MGRLRYFVVFYRWDLNLMWVPDDDPEARVWDTRGDAKRRAKRLRQRWRDKGENPAGLVKVVEMTEVRRRG